MLSISDCTVEINNKIKVIMGIAFDIIKNLNYLYKEYYIYLIVELVVTLVSLMNKSLFLKIVVILTKAIDISNHAITLLNKGINSFKLEPVDDCILTSGKFNKLL